MRYDNSYQRKYFYGYCKEQIRQIIADNNFTNVVDVYDYLKEGFKDILQEFMEAKMDATFGYKKIKKGGNAFTNERSGYFTKTLKSQYGEFPITIPRDRNGEFEPKLISKYQRNSSVIEEKVLT